MSLITLIIVFACDIILGLISIAWAKCKIRKDQDYINTFVEKVMCLLDPKASKYTKNESIDYILENYNEASNIIGEDMYKMPISEFGVNISYDNPIDESLFIRIDSEWREFNGAKRREIKKLNKQRFNPFNLLYRGVELVMNFVFGYFISKINSEFNHEQNKAWKLFNSIITIVGSIASILSYLHQIL